MATLNIGGVNYNFNVDADQEARLMEVAELWDKYVQQIKAGGGSRDQILVIAGLTMADEFYALKKAQDGGDEALAGLQNKIAERLEKLCDQLG